MSFYELENKPAQSNSGGSLAIKYVYEDLPLVRDWMAVGKLKKVIDGDTIELSIEAVGKEASKYIAASGYQRIRFVGIQTPETKKDYTTYDDNANLIIQKQYKLKSIDDVFQIAAEATKRTESILSGSGYIVIDFEAKFQHVSGSNYSMVGIDEDNGRLIGMVYKTKSTSLDGILTKVTPIQAINLNKTLLMTPSSRPGVPLASVYRTDETGINLSETGEQSRFDVAMWGVIYGLNPQKIIEQIEAETYRLSRQDKHKAILQIYRSSVDQIITVNHLVQKDEEIYGIAEQYNTSAYLIADYNRVSLTELEKHLAVGSTLIIPYIPSLDINRLEYANVYTASEDNRSVIEPLNDREDMRSKYHVRIGDVELVIPPLAIEVIRTSQAEKVKTLRSKQSMVLKVGSSQTVIRLQLFFNGLDSINGYRTKGPDQDYYMDGLRPLIAQFHKAPFLPIENEYINEVLGIHSVALANLNVTTVPGFPHSISATIELARFEHEAYMPHITFLEEAFNYPLLRWYYQQSMHPQESHNTYFAPIEGQLTNHFVFQIADEDYLSDRQQDLKQLGFLDSPALMEAKTQGGANLFGKLMQDRDRLLAVREQYERYLRIKKENPDLDKIRPNSKIDKTIKGDDKWDIEKGFIPKEFVIDKEYEEAGKEVILDIFGIPLLYKVIQAENAEGLAMLKLEAPSNRGLFESSYTEEDIYAIPITDPRLDRIIENGKNAELAYQGYMNSLNRLYEKSTVVEGDIPLVDEPIEDLILTSINVFYSNSFSNAQLQELESPTLQYLGGQDPNIRLTFEATSREAVIALRHIIDETERFSREYRYGITSGFMGFKNQLTALFGIQTVICENLVVNTVPGFVDRFQIDMVLCGFNKTQKRQETLNGIALGENDTKEDRQLNNDPTQNDMVILEQKLQELEVYPDLELPTYEEINSIIPKINRLYGLSIQTLKNPGNARFVDPDFYVSTNETYRTLLKTLVDSPDQSELIIQDYMDGKGYTKMDGMQAFFADPDMLDFILGISSRTSNLRISYSDINSIYAGFGQGVTSGNGFTVNQLLNTDIRTRSNLTVQQIDAWIRAKAPSNSVMIGKGAAYIEAQEKSGLNAEYLVAHSAIETGWGVSKIVREKANFYGIGAFDKTAYESAYSMGGLGADKYYDGIINGAMWIREEYADIGQHTLYLMQNDPKVPYGKKGHNYATDREAGHPLALPIDETSDPKSWGQKIASTWAASPASRPVTVDSIISDPRVPNKKRAISGDSSSVTMEATHDTTYKNPRYVDVYKKLEELVDLFFVETNLVVNDKTDRTNAKHTVITYANNEDIYRASYNAIAEKSGMAKIEEPKTFSQADFANLGNKITRERMLNIFKGLLHYYSKWAQFTEKEKPILDEASTRIGMGGVSLTIYARNEEEGGRLAWDWKYNLSKTVEIFHSHYVEALGSQNIEIASRPWDWAIRAYENGSLVEHHDPAQRVSLYGKLNTNSYRLIWDIIEGSPSSTEDRSGLAGLYGGGIGAIFSSPAKFRDEDIAKHLNLLTDLQFKIIINDRETLVNEVLALKPGAFYKVEELIASADENALRRKMIEAVGSDQIPQSLFDETRRAFGLWDSRYEHNVLSDLSSKNMADLVKDSVKYKKILLTDSGIFTDEQIAKLYKEVVGAAHTYSKQAYDPNSGLQYETPVTPAGVVANEQVHNYEEIKEYRELSNEKGRLSMAEFGAGESDPDQLFKDSFTDIFDYDQRGRLIRAFPTFQMFIIDEGKWMSSYRLWDNLYGFNSIISIDVHKDRKIAADTAIIEMSNIYSNLSSYRVDANYGKWDYTLGWNSLLWGEPNETLIESRKELVDSMHLKTGARIHLRVGYSSNASDLPIMFNGTITEMDTQSIVTIVAQGDGIELSNAPLSTNPKETNDRGIFSPILEPRDLLCEFLVSKGNWFKDVLNHHTGGRLFDEHPLGIMHFGAPKKVPTGPLSWWNHNYGEAAQNIYSSNGYNTFSQWVMTEEMEEKGWITWDGFIPKWTGDEMNIELKLFGLTYWDLAQTIAYCSPDYIAAVHPFELRSTLFFGKPYYRVAYRYDSAYEWDSEAVGFKRSLKKEIRKPFMQYRIYDNYSSIISNGIKASEEGVFTNVIATYDGDKSSDMMYADFDIRFDKQKTAVVETPIVGNWVGSINDFWGAKKQANYYACSTLRDYMKDMYKGKLVVLGDPTAKPYDLVYMADTLNDMNGPFQVKNVTHHFSHETGFITSIGPDAYTVVDDQFMISQTMWLGAIGANFVAAVAGRRIGARALGKFASSAKGLKMIDMGKWTGRSALKLLTYIPSKKDPDIDEWKKAFRKYIDLANKGEDPSSALKEMDAATEKLVKKVEGWKTEGKIKEKGKKSIQSILSVIDQINKDIGGGVKASTALGNAADKITAKMPGRKVLKGIGLLLTLGGAINPLSIIAAIGLNVLAETLSQMYQRKKKAIQAVMVVPLKYQGRAFTAGVNGTQGMIVGSSPGKWDNFFMGLGFDGDGEGFDAWLGSALNFALDNDGHWMPIGDEWGRGTVEYSREYADVHAGEFNN